MREMHSMCYRIVLRQSQICIFLGIIRELVKLLRFSLSVPHVSEKLASEVHSPYQLDVLDQAQHLTLGLSSLS
jgi:hypothetical protein